MRGNAASSGALSFDFYLQCFSIASTSLAFCTLSYVKLTDVTIGRALATCVGGSSTRSSCKGESEHQGEVRSYSLPFTRDRPVGEIGEPPPSWRESAELPVAAGGPGTPGGSSSPPLPGYGDDPFECDDDAVQATGIEARREDSGGDEKHKTTKKAPPWLFFSRRRASTFNECCKIPLSSISPSFHLTLSSLGDERRTSERSIMVLLLLEDDDDGEQERSRLEEEAATARALDDEARVNISEDSFCLDFFLLRSFSFRPSSRLFGGRSCSFRVFYFPQKVTAATSGIDLKRRRRKRERGDGALAALLLL